MTPKGPGGLPVLRLRVQVDPDTPQVQNVQASHWGPAPDIAAMDRASRQRYLSTVRQRKRRLEKETNEQQ